MLKEAYINVKEHITLLDVISDGDITNKKTLSGRWISLLKSEIFDYSEASQVQIAKTAPMSSYGLEEVL